MLLHHKVREESKKNEKKIFKHIVGGLYGAYHATGHRLCY